MLIVVLLLSMVLVQGVVAYAKTDSGDTLGISYKFVGNVVQSGAYLKTTGSTYAKINISNTAKKTNYVKVEASMEYTNLNGIKAVVSVHVDKKIKERNVTLCTQKISKVKNGKAVIARVSHAFSSDGISTFAHTVW